MRRPTPTPGAQVGGVGGLSGGVARGRCAALRAGARASGFAASDIGGPMLRWTRRAQRGGGPTDGSYLSRPGPADRSRCLKPAPRAAARCPALGGARPGVGRGALRHGLPLTPPRHGALRSGVWRRCFFFLGAAAAACPARQTRGASAVAAAARPARALPTDCRPCPTPLLLNLQSRQRGGRGRGGARTGEGGGAQTPGSRRRRQPSCDSGAAAPEASSGEGRRRECAAGPGAGPAAPSGGQSGVRRNGAARRGCAAV